MSAREAFKRLSGSQRINGQLARAMGGVSLAVIDPATEEQIGEIAEATRRRRRSGRGAANEAQRSLAQRESPPARRIAA